MWTVIVVAISGIVTLLLQALLDAGGRPSRVRASIAADLDLLAKVPAALDRGALERRIQTQIDEYSRPLTQPQDRTTHEAKRAVERANRLQALATWVYVLVIVGVTGALLAGLPELTPAHFGLSSIALGGALMVGAFGWLSALRSVRSRIARNLETQLAALNVVVRKA